MTDETKSFGPLGDPLAGARELLADTWARINAAHYAFHLERQEMRERLWNDPDAFDDWVKEKWRTVALSMAPLQRQAEGLTHEIVRYEMLQLVPPMIVAEDGVSRPGLASITP